MTKRRPYPTDLTDAEWKIVEPLIPKPQRRGPKANVDVREIPNGIFYFLHEGCQWRALPHDFPPWTTVSITFANGKERAFGNSYSKPYALGFGKNKDEMESPVQELLILSR
jgi:transposase